MGEVQKCFHCGTGKLSMAIPNKDGDISIYCDNCKVVFTLAHEEEKQTCGECTCGKHKKPTKSVRPI